jgi:ABC-type transport system substrate-binding protein
MNRTATLIKDGQEFRFTLLVDPKERITGTIAKIIYQDLYKIGVRCDIKTYDHNNQDKELVQEAGAAVISFMILATLEPNWHSDKQQIIGKLWRYTNPETDRLFEQANITQDFKHRQALYHKIHRLVYAEQSGTFLYCLPNLCAISNRFGNTDRFFSPALPFYTIKEWEINKPFK